MFKKSGRRGLQTPRATGKLLTSACTIAHDQSKTLQVGGLGDVVTSLGRAVQEAGHTVEVVLPW